MRSATSAPEATLRPGSIMPPVPADPWKRARARRVTRAHMPRFRHETRLPFPPAEVFAWHARPGAFERLAPPWTAVRVRERTGTIREGDSIALEYERGPLKFAWSFRHRDFADGTGFVDEQLSG